MSTDPALLQELELETWDEFATRFARSSDLFLSKFIRAHAKRDDPAFDGSFRYFLNRAEKLGLIESASPWLEIRELRNVPVHDYTGSDLKIILEKMKNFTPLILELRSKLANAIV